MSLRLSWLPPINITVLSGIVSLNKELKPVNTND